MELVAGAVRMKSKDKLSFLRTMMASTLKWVWQSLSGAGVFLFIGLNASWATVYGFGLGPNFTSSYFGWMFPSPMWRVAWWSGALFAVFTLLMDPPLTRFAKRMFIVGAIYGGTIGAVSEFYGMFKLEQMITVVRSVAAVLQAVSALFVIAELPRRKL